MSKLDDVLDALKQTYEGDNNRRPKANSEVAGLWNVSEINDIRLHQTPDVWGMPMDTVNDEKKIAARAESTVRELAATMSRIISHGRVAIDIVSLSAPDEEFEEGIIEAINENHARCEAEGRDSPQIRFLFGYLSAFVNKVSGCYDYLNTFKANLKQRVRARNDGKPLDILWGRYVNKVEMGTAWNHSKIVAADGVACVVGGHNMWWADYAKDPPVHDVSVEVWGDAALHAQQFAEFLWRMGKKHGHLWYTSRLAGSDGWKSLRFDDGYVKELAHARLYSVDEGRFLKAKERARMSFKERVICYFKSDKDFSKSMEHARKTLANQGDFKEGRIVTVGRGGDKLCKKKYNASDLMKEVLMKGARSSICISQQDMTFAEQFRDITPHPICDILGQALGDNSKLEVNIVVSATGARGGREGAYDFGTDGPLSAMKFILYAARNKDSKKFQSVVDRLNVAPIYFTETSLEGSKYRWPRKLMVQPNLLLAIKNPFKKKDSQRVDADAAPANHAKVFMVDGGDDDAVYVVGSDNLYPSPLAEINFVIEGKDAVDDFKEKYWDNLWEYSMDHVVTKGNLWRRSKLEELKEFSKTSVKISPHRQRINKEIKKSMEDVSGENNSKEDVSDEKLTSSKGKMKSLFDYDNIVSEALYSQE